MSGGRGRAGGGGGGGGKASSTSTRASPARANRPHSPSAPRWPAASGGLVSSSSFNELWGSSSFNELWGAVNAVTAAATGHAAKNSTSSSSPNKKQPQPQPHQAPTLPLIRAHRPPAPRPVSARATASGAAEFPSNSSSSSSIPPPPLLPEEVAARLDDSPALTALDLAVAALAAALAFALSSALAHWRRGGISSFSSLRAAALSSSSSSPFPLFPLLAALAAFALALVAARERSFASRAFSARELADPDSRFAELLGVDVHYKVAKPVTTVVAAAAAAAATADGSGGSEEEVTRPAAAAAPAIRFSIAAMHGFGAAAFSWSLVARPLADLLQACFTKHDMPGFGLTERPSKLGLAPYSLAFNGRLARAVADLELEKLKKTKGEEEEQEGKVKSSPLRVLMGHSLGAVCASAEAARDPSSIDALILVAPAIVAAANGKKQQRQQKGEDEDAPPRKRKRTTSSFSTLPMRLLSAAALLARSVAALIAGWSTRALIVLSWPFLVFLLRMAVRSFQFWENGLSAALGGVRSSSDSPPDPSSTSSETTPAGIPLWLSQRYRLPSLVRGWETGFLLFLLARVPVASGGFLAALKNAGREFFGGKPGEEKNSISSSPSPLTSGPPSARLAAAVRGGRVPLLVIHGDRDALVPVRNSERLVEQLNNSGGEEFDRKSEESDGNPAPPLCELVVLRGRGHCPQEEAPREFVEACVAFLERVEKEKK